MDETKAQSWRWRWRWITVLKAVNIHSRSKLGGIRWFGVWSYESNPVSGTDVAFGLRNTSASFSFLPCAPSTLFLQWARPLDYQKKNCYGSVSIIFPNWFFSSQIFECAFFFCSLKSSIRQSSLSSEIAFLKIFFLLTGLACARWKRFLYEVAYFTTAYIQYNNCCYAAVLIGSTLLLIWTMKLIDCFIDCYTAEQQIGWSKFN